MFTRTFKNTCCYSMNCRKINRLYQFQSSFIIFHSNKKRNKFI
ncbi:unnamed protein product [Schistosoma mattheei]|uniref:Uncharacterized protein n=1 Tax=Schistosoma mattheei TaxID=31246 RepID=A0A3P7YMM1_9TREM|nr:unnamed protein product [Schistosoma mattheei]